MNNKQTTPETIEQTTVPENGKINMNMGDVVYIEGLGRYILTGFTIDGKDYAALISLTNGNRYVEPQLVFNFFKLTKREFKKVSGNAKTVIVSKFYIDKELVTRKKLSKI